MTVSRGLGFGAWRAMIAGTPPPGPGVSPELGGGGGPQLSAAASRVPALRGSLEPPLPGALWPRVSRLWRFFLGSLLHHRPGPPRAPRGRFGPGGRHRIPISVSVDRAEARPAQRTYDRSQMRNWCLPGLGERFPAPCGKCNAVWGREHPSPGANLPWRRRLPAASGVLELTGWAAPAGVLHGGAGKGRARRPLAPRTARVVRELPVCSSLGVILLSPN